MISLYEHYYLLGKATMFNDGKFFVEFDDCGDKAWVDPTKVYKMAHMTIAGKPQKGNFKYFTRWDLKATGGRFFESNIISGAENSHMFTVKAHDGDVGTYPFTEIFQIGIGAQIGDDVIAYFDGRPYAFKGKI